MMPRKRISVFVILLLLPCVFSFILPEPLRSLFGDEDKESSERQSVTEQLSSQILPVALVTFTTSLFTNIVRMFLNGDFIDCSYDGDDWHWGYEGKYGPACWGSHYDACNGLQQSPIDIPAWQSFFFTQQETNPLKMSGYTAVRFNRLSNTGENYGDLEGTRVSNGIFKNNGHTAQLDAVAGLSADQGILEGGQLAGKYQILQLHFHWGATDSQGSEHTVNGRRYPLELHVVHTKVGEADPLNTPKGLSVTGFFFELDDNDNAALAPLTDSLTHIEESDSQLSFSAVTFSLVELLKPVAPIDGEALSSSYSTYSGSLTTPTCNEVVEWINFLTPLKISKAQLEQFRMLDDYDMEDIVDNFRPPQPLNGRRVNFWN